MKTAAVKCGADIYGAQKMNPNDYSDLWTFLPERRWVTCGLQAMLERPFDLACKASVLNAKNQKRK